jgi:hypothetical protein
MQLVYFKPVDEMALLELRRWKRVLPRWFKEEPDGPRRAQFGDVLDLVKRRLKIEQAKVEKTATITEVQVDELAELGFRISPIRGGGSVARHRVVSWGYYSDDPEWAISGGLASYEERYPATVTFEEIKKNLLWQDYEKLPEQAKWWREGFKDAREGREPSYWDIQHPPHVDGWCAGMGLDRDRDDDAVTAMIGRVIQAEEERSRLARQASR